MFYINNKLINKINEILFMHLLFYNHLSHANNKISKKLILIFKILQIKYENK